MKGALLLSCKCNRNPRRDGFAIVYDDALCMWRLMMWPILTPEQAARDNGIIVYATPSDAPVHFCPFCGEPVSATGAKDYTHVPRECHDEIASQAKKLEPHGPSADKGQPGRDWSVEQGMAQDAAEGVELPTPEEK